MTVLRQLREILTARERRRAGILLCLSVIGTMLETLGIVLVIPVAVLLMQQDLGTRYPRVQPWLDALGHPAQGNLVVAGMVLLVAVYVIKALFLGLVAWRQSQFLHGVQTRLSQQLFTIYLRQPYTFHLQRNSADLISNVINETGMVSLALSGGMVLVAEGLTLAGITGLLLVAEPEGALLVMLVLGASAWAFQAGTRGSLTRWSEARQHHDAQRYQRLQQGLGAAKDVKLLGREAEFLAQYGVHNAGGAAINQKLEVLQQLPRLWLEVLAVAGLAGLVIAMRARGLDTTSIVTVLGLFAAGAFRLIPSVNRLLNVQQTIQYGMPGLALVHAELKLAGPLPAPSGTLAPAAPAFHSVIEIDRVGYAYAPAGALVLQDVSASIRKGESVGFVGASGAGKTTLVDVILGLLSPASGRVMVDGRDIQHDLRGWQNQIGYVPQSVYLTDDTIRRNVAFGLADDQIDDAAVVRALRAAQLEDFVAGMPSGLETEVGERGVRLSGGQRQRIGIARALYHDPPVLVLDEATSALDTPTEQDVMQAVAALHRQKTMIIVAHRASTVEQCDRIFVIEDGGVVSQL